MVFVSTSGEAGSSGSGRTRWAVPLRPTAVSADWARQLAREQVRLAVGAPSCGGPTSMRPTYEEGRQMERLTPRLCYPFSGKFASGPPTAAP
ncbi:hypothetical protein BHE74_00008852 [Ensete ventricosum]|nr:hypothetical protein BHE74_00008852 [Ensete ventricosum]